MKLYIEFYMFIIRRSRVGKTLQKVFWCKMQLVVKAAWLRYD